nr:hypothetical protein [uncultured bacterium]
MYSNKALRDFRFYARMPLPIEVELRAHHLRPGRFVVRDIDMGGLFVESHDSDLYPNDVVEVAFVDGGGARFRARVVRHTPEGVGLMFLDYDHVSLGALQEIVADAQDRFSNNQLEIEEA